MTLLHTCGELLRELLAAVPLPVARALFLALPLAVLVWLWRLPTDDSSPRALKIWASLALLIQVAIYCFV